MSGNFDFSHGSDDEELFGSRGPSTTALAVAGPPLPLLWATFGLAAVGALLAWVLAIPVTMMLGWVLAGPLAFGVLAWFVSKDTAARATGLYSAPNWLNLGYRLAAGFSMLAVLLCALRIADWVGRL